MSQVLLFAIAGALLLAAGGFFEKEAWDKYQAWQKEKRFCVDYRYQYFGREDLGALSREVLNELDLEKRRADQEWIKVLHQGVDSDRARRINDYVFRIYRAVLPIQQGWLQKNGRYFQGKPTMVRPPDFERDRRITLPFGLTDQVADWRTPDVDYRDECAPVQLTAHVYEGPQGHGFVIEARIRIRDHIWRNQMHRGPDTSRSKGNYRWVQES